MHTIPLLKQGIGKMYVTLDFIRNRLVKLWVNRIKRELQNEKFLATVELEPTNSRLLDWCSYRLRHGTISTVNSYR